MQIRRVEAEAIAITESETYQVLLARAHRRTGGVPADRIVRHVLSVTHGGDWPVQRDALDAVLRRCASTRTDEIQSGLVIEAPPEAASTLGALFSGMAQLLQAAAALPMTGGGPVGRR
jgi:hypothetical protein